MVTDGLERFRLLVDVADRPGFVALVSGFLAARGANILELDSHVVEGEAGPRFYMRLEFGAPRDTLDLDRLGEQFGLAVRDLEGICWELVAVARRKRVCVLVSKQGHCALDLLARWREGEHPCDLSLVVSNHPDLAEEVGSFGVEYRHVPVLKGRKAESEEAMLELLDGSFDLLVLARYMQVLSGDFLARANVPAINIHHSFLPAFAGADPYARARARGVKIVGATAHYVTEDLDAGPIIEQDVGRVSHRDSTDAMTRAGRDIERTVLARAVSWHLADRVAVHGNSTVVFA